MNIARIIKIKFIICKEKHIDRWIAPNALQEELEIIWELAPVWKNKSNSIHDQFSIENLCAATIAAQ